MVANNNIEIPWQDPLYFAQKISDNYRDESWVFLYSGLNEKPDEKLGKKNSYLAIFPREKIICEDFFAAEKILKSSEERWFGYFSYEVAHDFEKFPKTKKSLINLPKIWLVNFDLVFDFDHKKKKLTAIFSDKKLLEKATSWNLQQAQIDRILPSELLSNFTDSSYLKTILKIKEMIASGDLYQTNLTRKFFGEFKQKQNQQSAFKTFIDLTKVSPANYSSFLKLGKNFVISSSPELFFQIKNRKIISRPIKGTAPRGFDAKSDRQNKLDLKKSPKERAENLMIVDLVRNDLSRICKAGTVIVKKLFSINTYKTIHHMSSEVHGELSEDCSSIDALQACFPPGSMTGAPKIKAMEIAAKEEKINRGIYSGAIGFIDQKSANFSVVIRTLIFQGKKFEFQTGGAITFDSDPQKELEEIFSKAAPLMKVIGS
jgi:para-aminobenzoate synthetase component 1